MSCKWNGRDNPRIVTGRHGDECQGEECAGCLPCTEPHCRVCRRTHHDQTCAECLAETRADLHDIARMCDALPEEVEHRGVEGEAMMLLGPATDPEAWGHHEASVLSGRLDIRELEVFHAKGCDNPKCTGCAGELHPLFVLGGWEMVWRDHLEAPTELRATLPRLVDFIDRHLHTLAAEPLIPFEDFARDLRRCAAHLEAVLHDGEQCDTGAPCMSCNVPLERKWGKDHASDGWACPRCHQRSTEDQYRFAVAHLHRKEATDLTDRDMEIRTGVKAGTVRVWARRGQVRRHVDSGRTLYSVSDVERRMRGEEAS